MQFDYTQLILVLVPILLYGMKLVVPMIPKWLIPILAPILGAALDILNSYLTGHSLSPMTGAVLGGLGVWLREVIDQVKKAATPTVP